jgi:tetratricopeptide (TPR) repeat protein
MRTDDETQLVESGNLSGGSQREWIESVTGKWQLYAGIALVITLSIAGFWWYTSHEEELNMQAVSHLARVRSAFDAGNYSRALTGDSIAAVGQDKALGLLEISDEFSGTDAGKIAALMAGNCLINLGRFEEAVAQFERAQGSEALVVEVGALKGLAACREVNKDFTGAAVLYEQAAQRSLNTGLEVDCLLAAALCFEKSGDKAKAGQLFTNIAKKYEASTVAPQAKSGLARLGMAID